MPETLTDEQRAAVEALAKVVDAARARERPGRAISDDERRTRAERSTAGRLRDLGGGRAGRRAPPDPAHLRAQGPARPEPHRAAAAAATASRTSTSCAASRSLTTAGLNLEGVRRVLELEAEVARLRPELERHPGRGPRGRRADPPPVPARPGAAVASPRCRPDRPRRTAHGAGGSPMSHRPQPLDAQDPGGAVAPPSSGPAPPNNPEVTPDHLLAAVLDQADGIAGPLLARVGVEPAAVAQPGRRTSSARLPQAVGGAEPAHRPRAARRARRRPTRLRTDMGDEYLSVEHLLLAMADRIGVDRDELLDALRDVRGSHRVTSQNPEEHVPGPRDVRPGPDRAGPPGQARPGHRPRRGDPPGHPGAVPPHQEQPGAHRRARRRQDRHRRGPGQPHRRGRRPRGPEGQAGHRPRPGLDGGRGQVPRRVRGAAEGGAEGDHRLRGRDHHLHRRAAHHRRRRRRPRGRWTPAT